MGRQLYVNARVVDKVKLDGSAVKKIREELALSQEEFARTYKIPKGTLLMWEWGRRHPSEASSVYLRLIQSEPKRIAGMLEKLGRPPRQRRRLLENAA